MRGHGIEEVGPRGEAIADDDFLVLFNGDNEATDFRLPAWPDGTWRVRVDTSLPTGEPGMQRVVAAGGSARLGGRSLWVLQKAAGIAPG